MICHRSAIPSIAVVSVILSSFGAWGETSSQTSDWPQWMGPGRDGIYRGPAISPFLPKAGPMVLWKKQVGAGFSSPVVQGRRLILFHRLEDREIVACLDAESGEELWTYGYPSGYVDNFGFDEGPRSTPLIHGETVYTYGAEGVLLALELETGNPLWKVNCETQFHPPQGFFGRACSPLIEGDILMINVGAPHGAGIVGFDKRSGKVLWKATSDEASYSSPSSASMAGKRYAFFFNREGLVALNPADGDLYFEYPWRPAMHASVNAATPVVVEDMVFLSTSYGKGATVLQIRPEGPKPLWEKDGILSNHYATSVHHNGYLFGFDGRQEHGCALRCVALKSGHIHWSHDGFKAGTVMIAGDQLWILTELGQLIIASTDSKAFQILAQAQVLGFKTRAYPALARGRFYARDEKRLVCLDFN